MYTYSRSPGRSPLVLAYPIRGSTLAAPTPPSRSITSISFFASDSCSLPPHAILFTAYRRGVMAP